MRITVTQIASILLTIGLCSRAFQDVSAKAVPIDVDDAEEDASKAEEQLEEELPILPPIILLDFANNTEEGNATAEEKSKRTVNSGLGYGLDQNALQPRKYSYYFPAGKSGTTVSIEESISPFLPKTIIERVQPNSQRGQFAPQQDSFASSFSDPSGRQSAKSQSVFGLRTKPQKVGASSSFQSYQNFFTTPKPADGSFAIQNLAFMNNDVSATTQSPLPFSAAEPIRYVTPSSANFHSGSFNYAGVGPTFATGNAQAYTSQRQSVQSNADSRGYGSASQSVRSSTVSPVSYNAGAQLTNGPRYTVENGIRYENKIYWKYPDGRVSDVPPSTYVETYAEYPQSLLDQPTSFQRPHSIYPTTTTATATTTATTTTTTENSVLSQGPVQFPTVPDQTGSEPNPYVSSESLSSLPQQQVYRLGYQNLLSQRQNVNLAQQRKPVATVATSYSFATSSASSAPPSSPSSPSYPSYPSYPSSASASSPSFSSASSYGRTKSGSSSPKLDCVSCHRQSPSRYVANSPNPEYTDTTEPPVNRTTTANRFFASSQKHGSGLAPTTKYTPKLQEYVDTILSENRGSQKQSFGTDLSGYSNLRYSDLLNYNPSISEYVSNPSSIRNVRPTFVQAGNSLIPVIILRVDGASPVQSRTSQNVNLKALLQQYLIQYAKSIEELEQPSTYDLGPESPSRGLGNNPVLDLIRLTQPDARDTPVYNSDSYTGKSSYETSNLDDPENFISHRYTGTLASQQKVKNVQIVEQPRFTNYKLSN